MIQNFPTGIGNYRENLIRAMAKLPSPFDKLKATPSEVEGSDHEFVLVGNAGNKLENWVEGKRQFEFRTVGSKPNSVPQHFFLPLELAPLKLDLFWTTPWGASIFLRGKYALTIYDLLYRRYPEIASLKARLYDVFISKWVAKRATIIFTISEFVKDDIERFLGIEREKIVNIRGAAGDAWQPFDDGDAQSLALDKHGIKKPFFVYLGNFRPHKNLQTLLRAFARLKGTKGVKLVVIGDVDAKGRRQDSQNLLNLLKNLKLQNKVILTGRIDSDQEVAAILREAVALVHPSFHEGFGLTVLEAMSCGCTVIAANTTSIPEVVGEAGILVDPHSVDELTEAMKTILAGERPELAQKGLKQAKKFSWERVAREVLKAFDDNRR